MIKTSECKFLDSDFFKMLNISFFYGALFSVFNKCKKHFDVNVLKQDEFMCQLIWNNTLFQNKSKTLYIYLIILVKFVMQCSLCTN